MIFLQMIIAWIYSHVLEYALHRWFLHKNISKTWFRFHWKQHHVNAKRSQMIDEKYQSWKYFWKDDEVIGLSILAVIHSPIAFFFPWAYGMLIVSALSYYFTHRMAHTRKDWGRNYLPWHYDHHMGPGQNHNWGVRLPVFDLILGTRKVYKDTKREKVMRFKTRRRRYRG